MITYYPYDDIYFVGTPKDGLVCIDKDSHAYEYCEYLRSRYGYSVVRDLDGDDYYVISVSAYRAKQVKTYAELDNSIRDDMDRGL